MFRKQVNPKVAAIATLLTLAAIQGVYWRTLVYRPPSGGAGPMGGGGAPASIPSIMGLEAVLVENWAGEDPGYADGPGWSARFSGPNALAEEADGSLLVSDSRNHCVRRISPTGRVSTVAGGGANGAGGNAVGPAATARFRYPSGIAVSKDGTVYIADTGNHRLCRLKAGQVDVLAGGSPGSVDGSGAAARFNSPGPLAIDRAGALWVMDTGNRKLRRVGANGAVTTPASTPPEIAATLGMPNRGAQETVSSADLGKGPISPSSFKTGIRSAAAALPSGVRIYGDLAHHVVYAQREGESPLLIAGRIQQGSTSISDSEGTGMRASFATPSAVLARPDGTVFVADYDGNRIRRLRLPAELVR